MGSWPLCCVALCLLGAGPLDTAVSQTPRHLVTKKGNKESLKCEQNLGHDSIYWYKQDSSKLLKIMFIYNNKELLLNERVSSRFLPKFPDKAHSTLHINSLELGDSATYFCASSKDTALQTHLLPVYKPPALARKPLVHVETPDENVCLQVSLPIYPMEQCYLYAHGKSCRILLEGTAGVHNKFTDVLRTPQTIKDSVLCTVNLN